MLNPGSFDILLAQVFRLATHVRAFNSATHSPREAQHKRLMRIVRANEQTAFGKRHQFDKIKSIADYQRYVPPHNYEELSPYIDAIAHGAINQLTAEQPFMFATTSGTTDRPKYIPITETHLRDYTHAFHVHNYHMIREYPRAAGGRFLVITSNDEEGRTAAGLPYGAVSGLLSKRQSPVIRRHFSAPYELCKLKDVDSKYYLMLRMALGVDLTSVIGCNPSSLLLFADQLKEHGETLIKDLRDGGVNQRYSPPAEIADAFAPYMRPDKKRAAALEQILNRDGFMTPKSIWPSLAILCCWKGGPMSFYLERLPEFFGDLPVRDFGYMASEGRGSIPLTNDGAGGALALTSHFFEFVHEDEIDSTNPKYLVADELALNQRYYIYFTTASGLYRYNINDLVKVVEFMNQTPIIEFVRKGVGVSSVTGEKITEEQVLVALTQTVRQLNLASVTNFTSEVEMGYPPHYVCFAEVRSALAEPVKTQFLRVFDDSLKSQNSEYADKRGSKRLGAPQLKELPAGTYARLRQQRVSEGAPEAQVKIPLLSLPKAFSERIALL